MKNLLSIVFLCFCAITAYGQNDNLHIGSGTMEPSAIIQTDATDRGVLIPRLTSAQKNAIPNPAIGLLVYDNTSSTFWYYDGAQWTELAASSASGTSSLISDNDNDTKVETEASPDEDILRFKINNTERLTIDNSLTKLNAGSLLVGTTPYATGTKFLYDEPYKAFRVGGTTGTQWSPPNIGSFSFATGINTTAKGIASVAFGNNTSALGYGSKAHGTTTTAIGTYSTSWGNTSIASGQYSTSFGSSAALGNYSLAFGVSNDANGYGSTAWGGNTIADGIYSTSVGLNTNASSVAETSIGLYPTQYTATSTSNWEPNDRVFTVGNGQSITDRNNALVITKSGTIFTGIDTIGASNRMVWMPHKGAFRAGIANTFSWDNQNIGEASVSFGFHNISSGDNSITWGNDNRAISDNATAFGFRCTANSFNSIATGQVTYALGNNSFSTGFNTTADANSSFTAGVKTKAHSLAEFVVGMNNTHYTPSSTTSWNINDRLFVIGNGQSDTQKSDAMVVYKSGYTEINNNTTVNGNEFKLSSDNYPEPSIIMDGLHHKWIEFQTNGVRKASIFYDRVKNSLSLNSETAAMVNVKGTSVGIGRFPTTQMLENNGNASKASAGSWLANSDKRLKKNIVKIPSDHALSKIMEMRGVTYEWNDDKTEYERPEGIQMGFIAQDLQVLFPEKVIEDDEGYLMTAYGDYDPLFVEAFKMQQSQIEALESKNEKLESMLLKLSDLVSELSMDSDKIKE